MDERLVGQQSGSDPLYTVYTPLVKVEIDDEM